MEKKEVESHTVTMFSCPYCETQFEDDEVWAEKCRDVCYKELLLKEKGLNKEES